MKWTGINNSNQLDFKINLANTFTFVLILHFSDRCIAYNKGDSVNQMDPQLNENTNIVTEPSSGTSNSGLINSAAEVDDTDEISGEVSAFHHWSFVNNSEMNYVTSFSLFRGDNWRTRANRFNLGVSGGPEFRFDGKLFNTRVDILVLSNCQRNGLFGYEKSLPLS